MVSLAFTSLLQLLCLLSLALVTARQSKFLMLVLISFHYTPHGLW